MNVLLLRVGVSLGDTCRAKVVEVRCELSAAVRARQCLGICRRPEVVPEAFEVRLPVSELIHVVHNFPEKCLRNRQLSNHGYPSGGEYINQHETVLNCGFRSSRNS